MNQTQAISRLRKLLGKDFGYRIDKAAKKADERAALSKQASELLAEKRLTEEAMKTRRAELLRDPEYQALRAKYDTLAKQHDEVSYYARNRPVTVGTSNGIFFSVRAEGDNWAEVIDKLEGKA